MITLRCSQLPHVFACPGFLTLPGPDVATGNPAGPLGSATHEAIGRIVSGQPVSIRDISARWTVDPKELRKLIMRARFVWRELGPMFPGAMPEAEVGFGDDDLLLTGHVDLVGFSVDTAAFLDWKSGYVDRDHYHQIMGYAACLLLGRYGMSGVTAFVAWLRSGHTERFVVTRSEAAAWWRRLKAEIAHAEFHPGEQCSHCPRSHACTALKAVARRDVEIFDAPDMTANLNRGLDTYTDAGVLELRHRSRRLRTLLDSLDSAIRRRAEVRPLTDGITELSVVTEPGARKIDAGKAWPILTARLNDDQLSGCVEIKATAMDAALRRAAGRGNGAAAVKVVNDELEAAGAITREPRETLREKRVKAETDHGKEIAASEGEAKTPPEQIV